MNLRGLARYTNGRPSWWVEKEELTVPGQVSALLQAFSQYPASNIL